MKQHLNPFFFFHINNKGTFNCECYVVAKKRHSHKQLLVIVRIIFYRTTGACMTSFYCVTSILPIIDHFCVIGLCINALMAAITEDE